MFFAVDIDGVLARDTIGYATSLNRYFQLGIADSVIEGLADYAQFITLEEVRSFVRGNEALAAEFNRVAKEAQYTELVQQLRVPVDGARVAMQEIAARYPFRYAEGEPLIFIDDLAETLMKSFAALIKYHYQDAKAIRKRCGLLAFGHSEAPVWPFSKPMYSVWPLPNWGEFGSLIGVGESILV